MRPSQEERISKSVCSLFLSHMAKLSELVSKCGRRALQIWLLQVSCYVGSLQFQEERQGKSCMVDTRIRQKSCMQKVYWVLFGKKNSLRESKRAEKLLIIIIININIEKNCMSWKVQVASQRDQKSKLCKRSEHTYLVIEQLFTLQMRKGTSS